MKFQKSDLLTYKNLSILMNSSLPNLRAKILSKKLTKYCFILEGEAKSSYYELNGNLTYRLSKQDISGKIELLSTQLLETSWLALSDEERTELKGPEINGKVSKKWTNLCANKTFAEYDTQLKNKLTIFEDDRRAKLINNTPMEIHYQNGYYDLKDKTLKQRVFGTHYITEYIKRDYAPSTRKQRRKMINYIKKVYPDEKTRETMLYILGSAMSGLSTIDQSSLFLTGLGSTGKSFIMELMLIVFECYVIELGPTTFDNNNPNLNKVMNSFLGNPQKRVAWINEPSEKKMNESTFKDFTDGKIKTVSLYSDGINIIKHNAKVINTSNTFPNILTTCTGNKRRLLSLEHKSEFTDDLSKVDESKHVYLKDKDSISNIVEMNLLNAWFDIIAEKCYEWFQVKTIEYSEEFIESKSAIVNINDIFQDFIDSDLVITNDPTDRIGKEEMRTAFINRYPTKHTTVIQVMTSLKQKRIKYSADSRINGIKGCYLGVRFRTEEDGDYEDTKEVVVDNNKTVDEELTKYQELEAKFNALQSKYDKLVLKTAKQETVKKPVCMIKPIDEPVTTEVSTKPKKKIAKKVVTETIDENNEITEEDAIKQFEGDSFFSFAN